jgi:hypothetical protein
VIETTEMTRPIQMTTEIVMKVVLPKKKDEGV